MCAHVIIILIFIIFDVFRDAVALRYGRIPPKMKSVCDGCGEDFTISHALDCKKGGLVAHRHNDFRDLNINLLHKSGLTQITEEPVLKESSADGDDGLRVDWSARSFWESQREALFDCCILNADAPLIWELPWKQFSLQVEISRKENIVQQLSLLGALLPQ